MKAIRYVGNGEVAVVEAPTPSCPAGGLLVRTEACGLCSGELMSWYMDRKIPHILGHEVAGIVVESDTRRFSIGNRVFPHHHAPCMQCDFCLQGQFVHCAQWKRTHLNPGGMAEFFAVGPENLSDTIDVGEMRAIDAALIEPLACVVKSVRFGNVSGSNPRVAIIGLGVMGLMHAKLNPGSVAYDRAEARVAWAQEIGIDARIPTFVGEGAAADEADIVYVCPGSQAAFDLGLKIVAPAGTIVMFAPLPPGESLRLPQEIYFRDICVRHSYSCGPADTAEAFRLIKNGTLSAEDVVSEFVEIDALPAAYQRMKSGEILKPMVVFNLGRNETTHSGILEMDR